MKKFNLKKWITENKHGKTQTEQLGPRIKSPRPTGPSDPRSSKDIEFDNAQAMSRLTPDDKDKLEKIKQMMDKEKQKLEARADWTPPPMGMGGEEEEDEEQEEYDKGWYGESLKELAAQLGYLDEEVLPISLQQLEKEIKDLTGEYGSVSERKPGIYRIKFSHVRQELDGRVWGELMKLIKSHPNDYEIIDAQNYYEANYDREEPAEQVPTINFK